MQPSTFHAVETAYLALAALGLIVGALWTYLRAVNGRAFASRMNTEVFAETITRADGSRAIKVRAELRNAGQSKLQITEGGVSLAAEIAGAGGGGGALYEQHFDRAARYRLMADLGALEPGEVRSAETLVGFQSSPGADAVRIALTAQARGGHTANSERIVQIPAEDRHTDQRKPEELQTVQSTATASATGAKVAVPPGESLDEPPAASVADLTPAQAATAALGAAKELKTEKASRYSLKEVEVDTGLAPALLISASPRHNGARRPDAKNPVLVWPSSGGKQFSVISARLPEENALSERELVAEAIRQSRGLESAYPGPGPRMGSRYLHQQRYGLFDYFPMTNHITAALNIGWQEPEDKEEKFSVEVLEWVRKRAGHAIKDRFHDYYKRTIAAIERRRPEVVGVQRAIFAATFSAPEIVFDERVYERPYLAADVIRYRAAAAALANLATLGRNLGYRPELLDTDRTALLDRMDGGDWRGLFSADGKGYRALNKTLDSLPGGVPATLLCGLAGVRLKEPVYRRAPLALACLYGQLAPLAGGQEFMTWHNPEETPGAQALATAEDGRIKRAMAIVGRYTHRELSWRRTQDLRVFANFLIDYPGASGHRGGIVSLAERAVRFHREEANSHARREAERIGIGREAARPPIELPDEKRLQFLASVERIVEEAHRMGHCVGSYSRKAVDGRCYLFHADYEGEAATVEVSPAGCVVQASGPHNRHNGAARWAYRELSRWAGSFPAEQEPARQEQVMDEIPF